MLNLTNGLLVIIRGKPLEGMGTVPGYTQRVESVKEIEGKPCALIDGDWYPPESLEIRPKGDLDEDEQSQLEAQEWNSKVRSHKDEPYTERLEVPIQPFTKERLDLYCKENKQSLQDAVNEAVKVLLDDAGY
jgi:hypothetical protein